MAVRKKTPECLRRNDEIYRKPEAILEFFKMFKMLIFDRFFSQQILSADSFLFLAEIKTPLLIVDNSHAMGPEFSSSL